MQLPRLNSPLFILAALVIVAICLVRVINPDFVDQIECKTYDWRVRVANQVACPAASDFAFVAMDDSSIAAIQGGLLGRSYGLYWPRHIYGRVVEELSAENAQVIGFDILFGELRPDHAPVVLSDGSLIESDDFFAEQMAANRRVILARTPDVEPPDLFRTNCLTLGDISSEKDSDGILRRVKSFYFSWHPAFRAAAKEYGIDLAKAQIQPEEITLVESDGTKLTVHLDNQGNFDLKDFVGDKIPKGWSRYAKPFERVWNMGIVLAAQPLGLDLAHAQIDLENGHIVFQGKNGSQLKLPVDREGRFYIDWRIKASDTNLVRVPIQEIIKRDQSRLAGGSGDFEPSLKDKLVMVGSAAQGNDLTDRGATPLENDTLLISQHWNVANSLIHDEFISRSSLSGDLLMIVVLGALTSFLTWRLHAIAASFAVALCIAAYFVAATWAFLHLRLWLPIVYPIGGSMIALHGVLLVRMVVFEEQDKRRVKGIFSKLVSPHIVDELLETRQLALGGAHREVTIFFADIRGFTAFTDDAQEAVTAFLKEHPMEASQAKRYVEESARETLETVNRYLAVVAEAVKKHDGTLDKYIGDCVMAFWNAPATNEQHGLASVRAAIEAQLAVYKLNEEQLSQAPAREVENQARQSAGLPAKPMPIALQLGTGINTGRVTVGLMGSEEHGFNYTVFGREVNLASRLEGVSGSGRIIISQTTYQELLRDDPALAGQCVALAPEKFKGFRDAVATYEVPWQHR